MNRATAIASVSLPGADRAFLRTLLRRGWPARDALAEAFAHFAENENGRALATSVHADLTARWVARARVRTAVQSQSNRVG